MALLAVTVTAEARQPEPGATSTPASGTSTPVATPAVVPSLPPGPPTPPVPASSDLVVSLRPFHPPRVAGPLTLEGDICNGSLTWNAVSIQLTFQFYDDSLYPTADSGTHLVSEVPAGQCRAFAADLRTSGPWHLVSADRVEWLWDLPPR